MKIIDPSPSAQARRQAERRLKQEYLLDQKIIALRKELVEVLGIQTPLEQILPPQLKTQDKHESVMFLRLMIMDALQNKLVHMQSLKLIPPPSPTFTCFSNLPPELRLKIWDYTLENHCHERIHSVDVSEKDRNEFMAGDYDAENPQHLIKVISNQLIHPTLHVCHESRMQYLYRTGASFSSHLATYINFNTDVIYIPNNDFAAEIFRKLVQDSRRCPNQLQRIAMPAQLYCNLPMDDGERLETVHFDMRDAMPAWRETLIVFADDVFMNLWSETKWKIVELTAKQKRLRVREAMQGNMSGY
ncbi:uncharacterized protein LY89DRAFT_746956 [Mollisia scopiformis]|uniref:2EXR domain-containing protein n=1 Tax=Mollisia scopiformis TaxID=149040 RepID=A0A194XB69_MOLSC|nr:uncharacterized protein LY89DRAFT_746956 [Mollisia scopiformis]KUJ17413.1 hypothetical protein LY89DRAFT_746956 [Mollisia scopiformis]